MTITLGNTTLCAGQARNSTGDPVGPSEPTEGLRIECMRRKPAKVVGWLRRQELFQYGQVRRLHTGKKEPLHSLPGQHFIGDFRQPAMQNAEENAIDILHPMPQTGESPFERYQASNHSNTV